MFLPPDIDTTTVIAIALNDEERSYFDVTRVNEGLDAIESIEYYCATVIWTHDKVYLNDLYEDADTDDEGVYSPVTWYWVPRSPSPDVYRRDANDYR